MKSVKFAVFCALLMVGALGTATGAASIGHSAGEFVLPAGQTASLTDTVLNSCNSITYGYAVSGGPFVAFGSKGNVCTAVPSGNATIGPFQATVILRLVLVDNKCGETFDSTGGHASVTGSNPYKVNITDAGAGCEAPAGTTRPPGGPNGEGNLSTTLTIGANVNCAAAPPSGAIVGTAGNDNLVGTTGSDVIFGLGGHDKIAGGGGNDIICGGAGNDRIAGGDGADNMHGGLGNDQCAGGNGTDTAVACETVVGVP